MISDGLDMGLDPIKRDGGNDPYTSLPSGGAPRISSRPGQPFSTAANIRQQTPDATKASSVKYQLEGLLGSDSKYIKSARNKSMEYASSRGLANSSIAAGAGEKAAIESALPIAQQDASTNAGLQTQTNDFNIRRDLADQGYEQTLGVNSQQFGHQTQLNDQNFNNSLRTNDQQFGHQTKLNDQNFGNTTALTDQQGRIATDAASQDYRQKFNLNNQTIKSQFEGVNRQSMAQLEQQYTKDVGNYRTSMDSQIKDVMADDKIPAAKKNDIINSIRANGESSILAIKSMYQSLPGWSSAWISI